MMMKKITFLNENLNVSKSEPSATAQEAKRLGLVYVGFGRYEDPKTNQITHIVQNNRLVPFRKAVKTNTYKQSGGSDFESYQQTMAPEIEQLQSVLTNHYTPEKYDDAELDALYSFTQEAYDTVNDRLSSLPLDISAKDIMPQSSDDPVPQIIEQMDSVIKKSRTPQEFVVYTKVGEDYNFSNFEPGKSFRFKGFRSTTIAMSNLIAEDPSAQKMAVLQIRVKKNTKGIYAADFSANPNDQEFILPRGAKIDVVAGPSKIVGGNQGSNLEIIYLDCVTKG